MSTTICFTPLPSVLFQKVSPLPSIAALAAVRSPPVAETTFQSFTGTSLSTKSDSPSRISSIQKAATRFIFTRPRADVTHTLNAEASHSGKRNSLLYPTVVPSATRFHSPFTWASTANASTRCPLATSSHNITVFTVAPFPCTLYIWGVPTVSTLYLSPSASKLRDKFRDT